MSELKMTGIAQHSDSASVGVQSLEAGSWHQENVEEKVRSKLIEFAAELHRIKTLRETN